MSSLEQSWLGRSSRLDGREGSTRRNGVMPQLVKSEGLGASGRLTQNLPPSAFSRGAGGVVPYGNCGATLELMLAPQRNLDDIRAVLTHHADNGRIPDAPKVPAVPDRYR